MTAKITPERRLGKSREDWQLRAAYHESSHALLAHVLGRKVEEICTYDRREAYAGICTHRGPPEPLTLVIVLLAGERSDSMFFDTPPLDESAGSRAPRSHNGLLPKCITMRHSGR